MTSERPDPDELLARVRDEEQKSKRGRLTIFFGAAPGVGKTYTMLESARLEVDQKRNVVVGIVETHGRYDTGAMLVGLDLIGRRKLEHRGISLEELDLDAALARHPELILIDELAHTNAPGSRHAKRWQDVEELLLAGIDVFTTLNVQHLESLNDIVAQITHVVVRETVPDAVFDQAHDVRLVDLPIDELLDRLKEGKVYISEQAKRAADGFFREGNLLALRELALRRTAERVDAQMRGYKAAHGIVETWHTGERVLVCVSPSPHSGRLIRAARRMATRVHAELVGLYVETPAALRMSATDRERLAQHLRLVESLGGEPVTLRADDAANETVRYARKRNVTQIVLGKPTHSRWRDILQPPFLDKVVRQSKEIDVYVMSGLAEDGASPKSAPSAEVSSRRPSRLAWAASAGIVLASTLLSWLVFGHDQLADVVMVYLLGVVIVSMRFGSGPSALAAVLSVLAFDFFFIPPFFSFSVSDLRHVTTFAVMFVVAIIVSQLTKRIQDQATAARERERHTASLYAISRELGIAPSRAELLATAARHLRETFHAKVAVLLPADDGRLERALEDAGTFDDSGKDAAAAEWVWTNQRPAGASTQTLPSSRALCVPLKGSRGRVGVLALFASGKSGLRDADERQLLDTFTGLIGSSLERTAAVDEARRARLRVETEQLRNALLSSVSHDLRTPLGVVTGATSALLDANAPKDEATRRELLQTAHEEALRLNRLVGNLLDMTRLEAGALKVHKDLQPLEEVVGSALQRMDDRLLDRKVALDVPADLPLVPFDSALVEQVLINLIENALKYTPASSPLALTARVLEVDASVEVQIADRGPGVAEAEHDKVFDKFYRVHEGEGGGAGLGLAICRGIVSAHGGRIWVTDRQGGGAVFHFTLPLDPAASARLAAKSEIRERP